MADKRYWMTLIDREFSMCALINRMKKKATMLCCVALTGTALIATVAAPASAQDLQALLDRIERLERDIRTLNTQIARGGGAASTVAAADGAVTNTADGAVNPAGLAHLDARIATIEADLRSVTGNVEELGHKIDQMTSRIDKLIGDVDFRLSELEQGRATPRPALEQGNGLIDQDGSQAPKSVTAQGSQGTGVLGTITADQLSNMDSGDGATSADDTTVSTSDSGTLSTEELAAPSPAGENQDTEVASLPPQDAYAQAFALLRQAKYDEAAVALQAFVDEHGEHELASNARYWLGETYYVRSEYVRAAEIFFEAYRLAPQGPKAPDTLLKLGMALGNLGKNAEACAAFTKLEQEYPNPSPAITSKLERERARNNCGG